MRGPRIETASPLPARRSERPDGCPSVAIGDDAFVAFVAGTIAAAFGAAVAVHAAHFAPLDHVPDGAGRGAIDDLAALHLLDPVGGVDAVQDHVAHDRVGAVDDHLAVDDRPHVH